MLRLCFLVSLAVALPVSAQEPIPGDLDRDGDVDYADLVVLAQNFGKTGPPPDPPKSESAKRLERLSGFWTFHTQADTFAFMFGRVVSQHDTAGFAWDGIVGVDSQGLIVSGLWEGGVYIVVYPRADDEIWITFELEDNQPKGFIVRWAKGERVLEPDPPLVILPDSGQKPGPGFVQHELQPRE